MQTFDVYLKKRLTEIDVIITQLVQRDTFSMYNQLYLLCSLSELEILKSIAVHTSMELTAQIDNLLETVRETIDSKVTLDCDLDLLKETFAKGETKMELSVDQISAIEKDLISGSSNLEISVSPLDYMIFRSFGKADFDMEMSTNKLQFTKEGFEKFENELEMFIESEFSAEKKFGLKELKTILKVDPVGLFYLLPVMGQTMMYLSTSKISDYVLKKVIHDTDFKTELTAYMDRELSAQKFINTENTLYLFAKMADVLINFIQLNDNEMIMSCVASAGLKRYRLLYEVDDLSLNDMDEMTLDELDYVILVD